MKVSCLVSAKTKSIVFILSLTLWSSGGWLLANPGKTAVSLLQQSCVDCHGGFETNADVNLKRLRNSRHLRNDPELIVRVMNAVADRTMPPDGAPVLDNSVRSELLAGLGEVLRQVEFETAVMSDGMARLNRFQ